MARISEYISLSAERYIRCSSSKFEEIALDVSFELVGRVP